MIRVLGRYIKKAQASPIWLTVFCDMTTNLMLFFLLLYGFTRLPQEQQQKIYKSLESSGKKAETIKYKASRVLKEYHEEETASAMNKLAGSVGGDMEDIKVNMKQIRLSLKSPILFDSGQAKLISKQGIEQLAKILRFGENQVIIEGHTDDQPVKKGPYSSNWELSVARSVSVIEALIKEYGFAASRFIAAGYGEYHPRYPNDSSENMASNRRIEIVVLRQNEAVKKQ